MRAISPARQQCIVRAGATVQTIQNARTAGRPAVRRPAERPPPPGRAPRILDRGPPRPVVSHARDGRRTPWPRTRSDLHRHAAGSVRVLAPGPLRLRGVQGAGRLHCVRGHRPLWEKHSIQTARGILEQEGALKQPCH
eukprot:scaffold686_cov342-Prasinococcus_capsulatus_cf.AAC.1